MTIIRADNTDIILLLAGEVVNLKITVLVGDLFILNRLFLKHTQILNIAPYFFLNLEEFELGGNNDGYCLQSVTIVPTDVVADIPSNTVINYECYMLRTFCRHNLFMNLKVVYSIQFFSWRHACLYLL